MMKFCPYDGPIYVSTGDTLFIERLDGRWRMYHYVDILGMPKVADMPKNWIIA